MTDQAPDIEEQLQMIAVICESLPPHELNSDVMAGVSFAVGFICGVTDRAEADQ